MESFRLTREEAETLAARHQTPFLVISLAQVEKQYDMFRRNLPRVNAYYAMKANPAPRVLSLLASLGAGFDTASAGEMRTLAEIGVEGSRMIYANPVKTPEGLRPAARRRGPQLQRLREQPRRLRGVHRLQGREQ